MALMASANWLCFLTYSSSGMWPSCQSPYISLPMPQNLTPYGSGWPLAARSLPIGVSGRAVGVLDLLDGHGDVAQAAVDGDVGLGADEPHRSMNSSMPTSLCSTPFQAGFLRGGRRSRSPMPSRQS